MLGLAQNARASDFRSLANRTCHARPSSHARELELLELLALAILATCHFPDAGVCVLTVVKGDATVTIP